MKYDLIRVRIFEKFCRFISIAQHTRRSLKTIKRVNARF